MSLRRITTNFCGIIGWLFFAGLGGLIVWNSRGYLHGPSEMPFSAEKAPISETLIWRSALIVHVAGGMICLAASLLQFFKSVLRRWPAVHRRMGILYARSVLWMLCPSGFVLAISAKGGVFGQTGFFVLGVVTFYTTWRGVLEMRAGRTRRHARWMIRSFAMITSAISFRILHIAFFNAGWDDETNYLTALWLSIVGNAAGAELFARMIPLSPEPSPTNRNETKPSYHPVLRGTLHS